MFKFNGLQRKVAFFSVLVTFGRSPVLGQIETGEILGVVTVQLQTRKDGASSPREGRAKVPERNFCSA
jgi:hypothetical protein